MAYNTKGVFYLDTAIATTTSAGDGIATLDLSSYVQPIARGRTKGQGLAIYKVWWDIADAGSNSPVANSTTGAFRAGLISFTGLPAAAVGGASLTNELIAADNDLMISGVDYAAPATTTADAEGTPYKDVWLEPSTEVPYIVVRDQVALMISVATAMNNGANVNVRLECGIMPLDSATLNQLLRTQTV
jgi:hypothetical protein